MPERRRYTKKQEAEAVGLALAKGQTAASEELGIPLSNVHRWYKRADLADLGSTARAEVAEAMWTAVQVGVSQMVHGLEDPKTPLRDKTDATSMLAEKYLLLTGGATSRTETRDLTDSLDDHEREALADAIDQWLTERGADTAPALPEGEATADLR